MPEKELLEDGPSLLTWALSEFYECTLWWNSVVVAKLNFPEGLGGFIKKPRPFNHIFGGDRILSA